MDIPYVTFSAESASPTDCVFWAGRSIVNGSFIDAVRSDIPAAARAGYRALDGITTYFGSSSAEVAFSTDMALAVDQLAAALGVVSAAAGASAFPWQLLIDALIKAILELLANREA